MVQMAIRTTDNTKKVLADELSNNTALKDIAGKSIEDLIRENPKLLIFPDSIEKTEDRIGESDQCLFSLYDNKLTTYNLMGFIGLNQTQVTITSRFSEPDQRDYFLHYLLQKVFHINIFDLPFTISNDPIWEWYVYLFPVFLNRAMKQGIYKEYARKQYNDARIKGAIDIPRHIKQNTPFLGNIAYSVREYCTDNPVTQLVRHAIEYIKSNTTWKTVLSSNSDVIEQARQIEWNTSGYNKYDVHKIIRANSVKPVRHPYFTEYKNLQTLCLHLLRHNKISFGNEKDTIFGIVFDGAWLWEEYLNAIFKENNMGIEHPQNKKGTGGDTLFKDRGQSIFPDFIKRKDEIKTAHYIADAKYKYSAVKEDYYQLITYMYRYESKLGYLFFPREHKEDSRKREIDGDTPNREIHEISLPIPINQKDYRSFCNAMKNNEKMLAEKLEWKP